MLNYVKSELFRLKKNKILWAFIGIISLWIVTLPIFMYSTPEDALGLIADSMIVVYALTIVIAIVVVLGEYKNGTIKNSLALGLSESKIYIGKIIASIIVGVTMLVFEDILAIMSTCLFSWGDAIVEVPQFIQASVVCTPAFSASIVFAISAYFICKNEVLAVGIWFFLMLEGEIASVIFINSDVAYKIVNNTWLPLVMMRGYSGEDGLISPWFVSNGIINIIAVSIATIVLCIAITFIVLKKRKSSTSAYR